MQLTDNTWYLLPDGTRVRAVLVFRDPEPDGWRLDALDGARLYMWNAREGWLRLVHNPAEGCYDVLPCDLQFDDLREA